MATRDPRPPHPPRRNRRHRRHRHRRHSPRLKGISPHPQDSSSHLTSEPEPPCYRGQAIPIAHLHDLPGASMKRVKAAALLFLPAILLAAQTLAAQAPQQTPQTLTGRWLLTSDFFGTTRYLRLDLDQKPDQLTGTLNGTQLKGSLTGSHLALTGTSSDGGTSTFDATVQPNTFAGTLTFT